MLRLISVSLLMSVLACGGSGEDYGPDDPTPTEPEKIPNTAPIQEPTALYCPNGSALTYENFGAAFMAKYCTSCHSQYVPEEQRGGAPLAANFDTPEDIALWRAAILRTTGTAVTPKPDPDAPSSWQLAEGDDTGQDEPPATPVATMPPDGSVSPADKSALTEWLRCGAPGTKRIRGY